MRESTPTSQRFYRLLTSLCASLLLVEGLRLLFSWIRPQPGRAKTRQENHVDPIALLIDGDNISSELIEQLLIEAGKLGGVTIKRVYGNWTKPFVKKWHDACPRYGITAVHLTQTANGKNATDIAMAIDAMDLLNKGIKHFCLVTSDSDFTPLVRRLCEAGCKVYGIGRQKIAPPALTRACTTFTFIEQLEAPSQPQKHLNDSFTPSNGKQTIQQPSIALPPDALNEDNTTQNGTLTATPISVETLLSKAYLDASKGKNNEWVLVSRLGLSLRKFDKTFDTTKYAKDLSTLIKAYDSLFEVRKRENGHPEMRMIG
jgi:uncharacterized protein (TIGR00288 family)